MSNTGSGYVSFVCWTREIIDGKEALALRREIANLIRRHAQPGDDVAAAELIIGELLANVVRHAPGRMCVDLDWSEAQPTLHVHDSGPGIDRNFSDRPSEQQETGRGLNLISALSRGLSAERGPFGGARIAVKLPVSRGGVDESPIERCRVRNERGCPFPTRSEQI